MQKLTIGRSGLISETGEGLLGVLPAGRTMSRKNSFIGAKIKERWWRISDEDVSECAVEDVLDQQEEAYMLFYERDM